MKVLEQSMAVNPHTGRIWFLLAVQECPTANTTFRMYTSDDHGGRWDSMSQDKLDAMIQAVLERMQSRWAMN